MGRIWWVLLVAGCGGGGAPRPVAPSTAAPAPHEPAAPTIRGFGTGLSGLRANGSEVKVSVGRDPAAGDAAVLLVEYPKPTADPAGRDVWFETEVKDWTQARAMSFRIKPDHAVKISVSFMDRNHVAYTSWVELRGGEWQPVRVAFDEIQPNPYFQPPDAQRGGPIDVSEVKHVGFAPHDEVPGHLALTSFVLSD